MTNIISLPNDLLVRFFCELDLAQQARCACVCKQFKNIFTTYWEGEDKGEATEFLTLWKKWVQHSVVRIRENFSDAYWEGEAKKIFTGFPAVPKGGWKKWVQHPTPVKCAYGTIDLVARKFFLLDGLNSQKSGESDEEYLSRYEDALARYAALSNTAATPSSRFEHAFENVPGKITCSSKVQRWYRDNNLKFIAFDKGNEATIRGYLACRKDPDNQHFEIIACDNAMNSGDNPE